MTKSKKNRNRDTAMSKCFQSHYFSHFVMSHELIEIYLKRLFNYVKTIERAIKE